MNFNLINIQSWVPASLAECMCVCVCVCAVCVWISPGFGLGILCGRVAAVLFTAVIMSK